MIDPARRLGQEIADGLGESLDDERRGAQRVRLIEQARAKQQQGSRLHWKLAAAAAAILLLGLGIWWSATDPDTTTTTLTARVEGRPLSEGQWIHAEAGEPIAISFNDGSRVDVTSGSKVRPTRLAKSSVHLSIESGTLSSQITPAQGIEWTFLAGPYRVVVVGTKLEVGWNPGPEQLDVEVSEGEVRVLGPSLGSRGLSVTGQQKLRADRQGVYLTESEEALATAEEPVEGDIQASRAKAKVSDHESRGGPSRRDAGARNPQPQSKPPRRGVISPIRACIPKRFRLLKTRASRVSSKGFRHGSSSH